MINKIIKRREISNIDEGFCQQAHPVLRRIFWSRDVRSDHDLSCELKSLPTFESLTDITKAANLLADAIQSRKHILIVSDFDADGATSCTVAMRALSMLGSKKHSYIVPNRFEYGYGLTPEIVSLAAEQQPDIIVTVDNGISSVDGVAKANELGIDVVVTDHHLPGDSLPQAAAIVNPNQHGDKFPSKNIAGVGVIFYVMLAVRKVLADQCWFENRNEKVPNLATLLDIVALGTVADVVVLDHVNRILVEQGLKRIRAGRCIPGIKAILQVARRDFANVVSSDMGFAIGPRLNAAGRLDDMTVGIECLLTDDETKAQLIAQQLDDLNKERRAIEDTMKVDAQKQAAQIVADLEGDQLPSGFALYRADWHQGIVGIVAARVKEHFHRPVAAFANDTDDVLKGSVRSISGVHIRDVLERVSTRNPGLILKFGGHAMAAGLSIESRNFQAFQEAFDRAIYDMAEESVFKPVIESDDDLSGNDIALPLAKILRDGAPWGQGFPEPLFDGVFELKTYSVMKEKHLKLQLYKDGVGPIEAVMFNALDKYDIPATKKLHLAYKLHVNSFRGIDKPQLLIEHFNCINN